MYTPNALDNLVGQPVNVWMGDGTRCFSAVLESVIRDSNNGIQALVIVGKIHATAIANDHAMNEIVTLATTEMVIAWPAVFSVARAPGK